MHAPAQKPLVFIGYHGPRFHFAVHRRTVIRGLVIRRSLASLSTILPECSWSRFVLFFFQTRSRFLSVRDDECLDNLSISALLPFLFMRRFFAIRIRTVEILCALALFQWCWEKIGKSWESENKLGDESVENLHFCWIYIWIFIHAFALSITRYKTLTLCNTCPNSLHTLTIFLNARLPI